MAIFKTKEDQEKNNVKLIEYVSNHGIKKKWLADNTGIAYTAIYRILQGQTKLSAVRAKTIANALNVPIEEILD